MVDSMLVHIFASDREDKIPFEEGITSYSSGNLTSLGNSSKFLMSGPHIRSRFEYSNSNMEAEWIYQRLRTCLKVVGKPFSGFLPKSKELACHHPQF